MGWYSEVGYFQLWIFDPGKFVLESRGEETGAIWLEQALTQQCSIHVST